MKKYELIYVDPPWRYRSGKVQGAAINHYATMSDEELYQLPVAEIAADNCVLLLWATFPKLPEALRLIEAWGFPVQDSRLCMGKDKSIRKRLFSRPWLVDTQ